MPRQTEPSLAPEARVSGSTEGHKCSGARGLVGCDARYCTCEQLSHLSLLLLMALITVLKSCQRTRTDQSSGLQLQIVLHHSIEVNKSNSLRVELTQRVPALHNQT